MLKMIKSRMHSQPIKSGDTTFLNPFSYLQIRKNKHLARPMTNIEIDGGLLALLLRLFMGWKVKRISFDMTSLAPKVFKQAEESGQSLYFVGSKQEEISQAMVVIKSEFPKLNIIKYSNGYFSGN
ncbi:MAG: WecB/TagA/CpsF family glycosyltransferase, partial [Colwellia sp.]